MRRGVSASAILSLPKNEILYSLKPEDFTLATVEFLAEGTHRVNYVRRPFLREPDFVVTSANYDFADLLFTAKSPQQVRRRHCRTIGRLARAFAKA